MSAEETTLLERVTLLTDAFAALYPARIVTRNLLDHDNRTPAELDAGIYTLVSLGEGGYKNYNGREAMDGSHRLLLVGQCRVEEGSSGSILEDAEFAMVEEVKAFMRAADPVKPAALCCLVMTGFRSSGQLDHPYGWIAVDLECAND